MQEDSSPCSRGQGPFLTIPEYAIRTGQSKKTVRRKIQQGLLHAVLADGPYGPEYRISCDGQPPSGLDTELTPREGTSSLPKAKEPTHGVGKEVVQPGDGPLPENLPDNLVMFLREQQQTIMELSGRLGFYQAENLQLKSQVQAMQVWILELEAPKQGPAETATHPAHVENGPNSGVEKASERPWWKFW